MKPGGGCRERVCPPARTLLKRALRHAGNGTGAFAGASAPIQSLSCLTMAGRHPAETRQLRSRRVAGSCKLFL